MSLIPHYSFLAHTVVLLLIWIYHGLPDFLCWIGTVLIIIIVHISCLSFLFFHPIRTLTYSTLRSLHTNNKYPHCSFTPFLVETPVSFTASELVHYISFSLSAYLLLAYFLHLDCILHCSLFFFRTFSNNLAWHFTTFHVVSRIPQATPLFY